MINFLYKLLGFGVAVDGVDTTVVVFVAAVVEFVAAGEQHWKKKVKKQHNYEIKKNFFLKTAVYVKYIFFFT